MDRELVIRMKQGDETAFTAIYRQLHPSLYVYMLRFCKMPSLAEDLVHDVFLRIWEIRERINPDLPFMGYLYRIARNHTFKTLQKLATDRTLREQLLNHIAKQGSEHPEELVKAREYDRLFHEALNHMPPQRLNVFRLCRQEGRSYDEAAAILGISRNAVKKHMVLSMRFIQNYVFRYGDVMLALYLSGKIIF